MQGELTTLSKQLLKCLAFAAARRALKAPRILLWCLPPRKQEAQEQGELHMVRAADDALQLQGLERKAASCCMLRRDLCSQALQPLKKGQCTPSGLANWRYNCMQQAAAASSGSPQAELSGKIAGWQLLRSTAVQSVMQQSLHSIACLHAQPTIWCQLEERQRCFSVHQQIKLDQGYKVGALILFEMATVIMPCPAYMGRPVIP